MADFNHDSTGTLKKVYTRLAHAYQKRRGLRLTADEVHRLVIGDDAIEQVVNQILYPEE